MLLWEIITPFGIPVEPLVYMTTAMSEGRGGRRSHAAATWTEMTVISCARELRLSNLQHGLQSATRGAKIHICAAQHNLAHPCLDFFPLGEGHEKGGLCFYLFLSLYTYWINRWDLKTSSGCHRPHMNYPNIHHFVLETFTLIIWWEQFTLPASLASVILLLVFRSYFFIHWSCFVLFRNKMMVTAFLHNMWNQVWKSPRMFKKQKLVLTLQKN